MSLLLSNELMLELGCLMIVLVPPLFFTYFILAERPQLIIIAIVSAFFWICSLLVSASIWSILPFIRTLWMFVTVYGVFVQEAFRFALLKLLIRVESFIRTHIHLSVVESAVPLNDMTTALASGVGFGTMHAIVMLGNVLFKSSGKGTFYTDSCPQIPLLYLTACLALLFMVLDVLLMCRMLVAIREDRSSELGTVVVLHSAASVVTVIDSFPAGCLGTIVFVLGVVIWTAVTSKTVILVDLMGKGAMKQPFHQDNKASR